MRKIVLIIAISILLFVTQGLAKKFSNVPFLEKVERTPASAEPVSVDRAGTYKDELISITWDPAPRGFEFEIINLSNATFSIVWQECYLSDTFNKYTIVHNGISNIRDLPPTQIDGGEKLSDFLYPAAFARFVRGVYTDLRQKSIYERKVGEKEAAAFTPQEFHVYLAIQAADTRYLYKFYFKTELVEK